MFSFFFPRACLLIYVQARMPGTIKTVLKIGSNMLLVVVVVLLGVVVVRVVVSQLKVVCFVVKALSSSSRSRK